jgi:hypothetical protein
VHQNATPAEALEIYREQTAVCGTVVAMAGAALADERKI